MKNNSLSQLLYSLATATGIALGMASMAIAQPTDAPLGEDRAAAAARQASVTVPRRNVAHSRLPTTFAGDFVLKKDVAASSYNGVTPDQFGTTTVMLPDTDPTSPTFGQPIPSKRPVRDLHYPLAFDANGRPTKVGMRMIPISEPHFDVPLDEEPDPKKPGSNLIDRFIRKTQGLSPTDPIFAIIVYLHPEKHSGDIKQLATEALKTEHGQTHLGMYFGKGFTRNSPETYHGQGWEVSGYPATVQLVSMDGTDQATLNRNGEIAAGILNAGVEFPNDYKNDVYQTITLGRTLAFYKGWLEDDPKLKTDNAWKTYCAEHVTIVTNIMVNVPHNEAAFQVIWGADVGRRLFGLAKAKYKAATGKDMPETAFEPLWKKDGIGDPTQVGVGDEVKQQDIGPGLAWPPQHNSDLLKNFLEVYASWPDVGAPASASALLGFKEQLIDRMTDHESDDPQAEQQKLSQAFDQLAIPVIMKMFLAEAQTKGSKQEQLIYAKQAQAQLYVAIGGKPADLAPGGTPDPQRMGLATKVHDVLLAKISAGELKTGLPVPLAYAGFKQAIQPEVDAARTINVSNPNKVVRYNSPPAVTHRVASGLHPGHSKVKIVEVATVFEANELQTKAEAAAAEAGPPPAGDDPGAAGRLNGINDGDADGGADGGTNGQVDGVGTWVPDGDETGADDNGGEGAEEIMIPHWVNWGETLWSISQRYGVSMRAIQLANDMGESTAVYAETFIKIPQHIAD